MSRVVLLYVGCEGQTQKITRRIASCLTSHGHEAVVYSLTELSHDFSLAGFDGVVVGSSIRYGKHHKPCYEFITRYADQLATLPGYFFSVNLTARKPERQEIYNNRYLQKFLQQIAWVPQRVEVFAGALLYTHYGWLDKQMIRLIMRLTGGPTDLTQNTEFTDWQRVESFAQQLHLDFQQKNPRAH